jgi:hypothetical protein
MQILALACAGGGLDGDGAFSGTHVEPHSFTPEAGMNAQPPEFNARKIRRRILLVNRVTRCPSHR